MDFAFTQEHDELRQAVRRFLENESPEQAVRAQMVSERGYDDRVWSQLAEQMGLPGLIVPEEHGGSGLGHIEMAIVLEEMGRTLLCAPYLSNAVLATNTLLEAADEKAQGELLPNIAAGKILATVALTEANGSWNVADLAMQAEADGDAWKLTGTKTYVLDGHVADVILVAARTDDGVSLFRVDADAVGLSRKLLPTLDLTRKLAQLDFAGTVATRIGAPGDLTAQVERAVALTVVALAAEMAGGAQRCLELSTEYAKTRIQFGRAIGSFQAIKHRCADMLVEVEFAKSAAYHAAFCAAGEDADDFVKAVSMAKSYCSEAYVHAAAETIQVHGGMGFTWEHPAHLYLKRAKSSELLFGDPLQHRGRLAERIGV
jgi:alkylation response protein AidB-like acyl-CoA dehydrogenase